MSLPKAQVGVIFCSIEEIATKERSSVNRTMFVREGESCRYTIKHAKIIALPLSSPCGTHTWYLGLRRNHSTKQQKQKQYTRCNPFPASRTITTPLVPVSLRCARTAELYVSASCRQHAESCWQLFLCRRESLDQNTPGPCKKPRSW